MAIESTRDLCLSVADAIREKKGTSELINPQDFAKEIASIEGGGSGGGELTGEYYLARPNGWYWKYIGKTPLTKGEDMDFLMGYAMDICLILSSVDNIYSSIDSIGYLPLPIASQFPASFGAFIASDTEDSISFPIAYAEKQITTMLLPFENVTLPSEDFFHLFCAVNELTPNDETEKAFEQTMMEYNFQRITEQEYNEIKASL